MFQAFLVISLPMSSVHWVTIEFRRPRDKNLDDCNPEKKFYTFLWETIWVCNVVEYWKLSYICKCIIWRGLCIKYVCKKYSQFLIALIWWIRSKHAIAAIKKSNPPRMQFCVATHFLFMSVEYGRLKLKF